MAACAILPFFWTGLHSALCGANDPVPLPLIGEHPDWEMELGVIVGKTGRYVKPEDAGDLIAGYVAINDLGTVDEFRRNARELSAALSSTVLSTPSWV